MSAPPTGVLFYDATAQPLSSIGVTQPGAYYQFYATQTLNLANVYADGFLTTPLSQTPGTGGTTANAAGKLPGVYLDPTVIYRYRLYNSQNVLITDIDPYLPTNIPTQATIGLVLYPRTSAEISASVTPTNYAYPLGNILRYGADPTGASSSDGAFNTGIAVLSQIPGGTLVFPAGLYSFSTANTSLNSKSGIVIQGVGSPSSGLQPGTRFQFTGAGSGVVFAMNGAQGVQFRGIQFVHTQAGFTGTYIQCNNNGIDPSGCGLYDCTLGASIGPVLHLDLQKCINFSCERCVFQYSGPSGSIRGAQAGGYANRVAFRDCEWFNGTAAYIQNSGPHQGWSFSGCDFEALSQVANSPPGALLSATSDGTWAGLDISGGCWFGDAGIGTGTWIDVYAQGFTFNGNYISGNQTGSTAFALRQSVGVVISGNVITTFLNGIKFALAACQDIVVKGNVFGTITNVWVNSNAVIPGTFDWGANFGAGAPPGHGAPTNAQGIRVYPDGSIEQWGSASVSASTGTITFAGSTGFNFPTTCNNIVATITSSANTNSIYISSKFSTGFNYAIAGTFSGTVTFDWQAIGT